MPFFTRCNTHVVCLQENVCKIVLTCRNTQYGDFVNQFRLSYKTQNVTISKIYGMHCSRGQNQIMRSTFFNTGSHFENIIFKRNRTDKNFPNRNTEPRYSLQYRDIEPQHIFTVIYRLTVYRCTLIVHKLEPKFNLILVHFHTGYILRCL